MTEMDYEVVEARPSPLQTLGRLRTLKNAVVGNPVAKASVCEAGYIDTMIRYLYNVTALPEEEDLVQTIQVEVANFIAILANGNVNASLELVRSGMVRVLLLCLAAPSTKRGGDLEHALLNALKSIITSCSSIIGSTEWGLPEDYTDVQREDARQAIESLLQYETLSIYLPALEHSHRTAVTVAYLIYATLSCWDTAAPRRVVALWLPQEESTDGIHSGFFGKDKLLGGWVAARLQRLLGRDDPKAQEAALLALGALASDNPSLSAMLIPPVEGPGIKTPLADVFEFATSRHPGVQLAAMLCATRILRSQKRDNIPKVTRPNRTTFEPLLTLIHLLNACIADTTLPIEIRAKHCFVFVILIADDIKIQDSMNSFQSLPVLLQVLHDNKPVEDNSEWADEVPASVARLREAAFLVLASATLNQEHSRREVLNLSVSGPSYMNLVLEGLSDPCRGVRYAACQCARALSRSVEVLRTSAIDSGLGLKLWDLLRKETDRRIQVVVLMCMSNLILDFSPLREKLIEEGVIKRITELVNHSDPVVIFNALWAIRNTLYRANPGDHRYVFSQLGMNRLWSLLTHSDERVRKQAIILVRNTTTKDTNCQYLLNELGTDKILTVLQEGIDDVDNDIVEHSVVALNNIAQMLNPKVFLEDPKLLASMKDRLTSRLPVVKPILEFTFAICKSSDHAAKRLKQEGFEAAVKQAKQDLESLSVSQENIDVATREITSILQAMEK